MKTVKRGNTVYEVKPAENTEGLLCRSFAGEYFLRVKDKNGIVTDYDILHSDLKITISSGQEGSLYTPLLKNPVDTEETSHTSFIDHSPSTLGHVENSVDAQEKLPEEGSCSSHPDAPHGFDRTASHSLGRYVCECEGWSEQE